MVDNLYFLFLDEIYSPNLNEMLNFSKGDIFSRKNHLHFGISGVIIPASHLQSFILKSIKIKNKYYSKYQNLILHYVDILNNKDVFSDLAVNIKKRKSFVDSISSFIVSSEFNYSCVFIDKHELIKKYGIYDRSGSIVKIRKIGSNHFPKSSILDYNLYLLCLKKIIESFFISLSNRKNPARGIIVAEARGEREDSELRSAFYKIYYQGALKVRPAELRGIILDLFIVPKRQNYIGTQIADLVLYPTYDGVVPYHNKRTDHIISFEKVLKGKLAKKDGVTIIP